jgi:hypothetical protein
MSTITPSMPPASYWQRGCDTGKADEPPFPPRRSPARPKPTLNEQWLEAAQMRGYLNGWRFGRQVAGLDPVPEGQELFFRKPEKSGHDL